MIFACAADNIDFTTKTCPCPDDLKCDTTTNHCFAPDTLTPSSTSPSCAPKSCDELGVECGVTDDGCSRVLECAKCLPGSSCNADTHRCVCQPLNCAAQGAECGEVASGCGEVFKCTGVCPVDRPNCGGNGPNKCGVNACTPLKCSGSRCGTLSDGCGAVLNCGNTCKAPAVCGGGGEANKCGCTAKTCSQAGWQCGSGPDECGNTRTCPQCTGGNNCDPNHKCVGGACVKLTCQTAGWECGSGSDGCGGTLSCGSCPGSVGNDHCKSNHTCEDD
jgi:hypothetical protein